METAGVLFQTTSDMVAVTKDDCYTPRWVFDAMGLRFDMDVAAPMGGPWHVPCDEYLTAQDDGLVTPWAGTVWCNPPYSAFTRWADKWATHPSGCLMGGYQPETRWTRTVFAAADAVAFVSARFTRPDGSTIKPRHGLFVAFRGVGLEPARALAAADKFGGSVLYGTPNN